MKLTLDNGIVVEGSAAEMAELLDHIGEALASPNGAAALNGFGLGKSDRIIVGVQDPVEITARRSNGRKRKDPKMKKQAKNPRPPCEACGKKHKVGNCKLAERCPPHAFVLSTPDAEGRSIGRCRKKGCAETREYTDGSVVDALQKGWGNGPTITSKRGKRRVA